MWQLNSRFFKRQISPPFLTIVKPFFSLLGCICAASYLRWSMFIWGCNFLNRFCIYLSFVCGPFMLTGGLMAYPFLLGDNTGNLWRNVFYEFLVIASIILLLLLLTWHLRRFVGVRTSHLADISYLPRRILSISDVIAQKGKSHIKGQLKTTAVA